MYPLARTQRGILRELDYTSSASVQEFEETSGLFEDEPELDEGAGGGREGGQGPELNEEEIEEETSDSSDEGDEEVEELEEEDELEEEGRPQSRDKSEWSGARGT